MVYTALGPGPADWLALPKGDASQHSQNSAHRSITPPCQHRGPAKDEMGPPPFGVKGGEMPRDAGSARGALEVLGRASSPIYLSIQPRSLFHPWDSGLGLTTDELETHKAKVIAGKLGLSLATP